MEEALRLRNDEEERWKMEEQKIMEQEFLNALIEEKKRRLEKENLVKIEREKKKTYIAFYNSDHWKRAKVDAIPVKRSKKDGSESSYYWSEQFVAAQKNRAVPYGCGDPDMTDSLKNVEPWVEV